MVLDFEGKISKCSSTSKLGNAIAFELPKAKVEAAYQLATTARAEVSSSRLIQKQCGSGEEKKKEEDESWRTDSEKIGRNPIWTWDGASTGGIPLRAAWVCP